MNTEENNTNSFSERALSVPSTQRVDYRNRTFRIVPQLMDLESCSDGSSNI